MLAATFELYLGWWNSFLRGANQVVAASRYAVAGYALQLILAIVLLLNGGGLLSLPVGTLAGGLLSRLFSRRACLRLLGERPSGSSGGEWALLRILWPNSWRVGLQFVAILVAIVAMVDLNFGDSHEQRPGQRAHRRSERQNKIRQCLMPTGLPREDMRFHR